MSEHENWIHIVSDGVNKIASPVYVKQKILDICALQDQIRSLTESVATLQGRVYELETPKRQQQIIKLLFEDGKPHTERWFTYRVPPYSKSKHWDLQGLVQQGKIEETRTGKNKTIYMYKIKR